MNVLKQRLQSLRQKMTLEGKLNWKLSVLVGKKHQISFLHATNQSLILIEARNVNQAPLISFQFKYLSKAIGTVALLTKYIWKTGKLLFR